MGDESPKQSPGLSVRLPARGTMPRKRGLGAKPPESGQLLRSDKRRFDSNFVSGSITLHDLCPWWANLSRNPDDDEGGNSGCRVPQQEYGGVLSPNMAGLQHPCSKVEPPKVVLAMREPLVKVRTLDIAHLRESSPQKRSGMARVLKGSHSFTCTLTRSIRNRNEPYLPLRS